MTANSEILTADREHRDRPIPITIDNKPYKAPKPIMTGAELRVLSEPDVPGDRDLWQEVAGPKDDIRVQPTDSVELKPGMHFYTAPSTINPGGH